MHGGWPSRWKVAYASLRAGQVCAHVCEARAQRRRRRADAQRFVVHNFPLVVAVPPLLHPRQPARSVGALAGAHGLELEIPDEPVLVAMHEDLAASVQLDAVGH